MLGSECPDCGVRLRNDKCPECGWVMKSAEAPKVLPPAYREFPARKLERSLPTDVCEDGMTVAEKIAEFKRHLATIEARNVRTRA